MAATQPHVAYLFNPATTNTLTFEDLQRQARRLCAGLLEKGLRPGDKVAVLMDNGLSTVQLFLGAIYGGFVVAPLNVRAGVSQLSFTLDHSDAKVVFVERQYDDLINEVKTHLRRAVETISADRDVFPVFAVSSSQMESLPPVQPQDAALLMYTSGSTGQPKAAIHTHGSLLAHGRNSVEAHKLTSQDRSLLVLPLYHINAECVTLLPALVSGGSVVVAQQFSVSEFWDWLDDYRCTWSAIVPTIVSQLIDWNDPKAGARADAFKRIRFLRSSSAPLSPSLHQEFLDKFDLPLIQAMGSSEAGNIFSNPVPPGANKLGSPGLPWGFELKVVDPQGGELPAGEPGEILIRGAGMMQGYYRDAAATAEAVDSEGWWHTGDLAYRDEGGYVFIVGRSKELVIKGGVNIAPKQIDEVLESFPAVMEAAAVGVPDRYLGEDLVAFVVLRSGMTCDEAEILRFCEARLGHFKTPTRIFFATDLPKGPSGKVQRLGLLEEATRLSSAPIAPQPTPPGDAVLSANLEQTIAAIWSTYLARPVSGADSNFFALGGHSLMALQCLSALREQLKIVVSLKEFFENPTIAQQAELVRARLGLQAGSSAVAEGGAGEADGPVPPRDRSLPCPLSLSQQRIWFMDKLNNGVPVYNEPDAVRLRGNLNTDALEGALNVVIGRHEILRTTVRMLGDEPTVVVKQNWRLRLKHVDLSALQPAKRDVELARLLADEPRLPFALTSEPGIRATLLHLGPMDHVLIVMMHHMICDRASMGVLWREFSDAYRAGVTGAPLELPDLPIQFSDFAVWQRLHVDERRLAEDLDYWQQKLRGAPTLIELPADRARPSVCSYRGARRRFSIPRNLVRLLRDFSQQEAVTLFTVFAAALDALLFRYTGQEQILVGIPLSERDRPELQPMIGFLLHTHVLQTYLSGNMSFRELLVTVKQGVMELYDHRSPPFDRVVGRVSPQRDPSCSPLFQVMMNWRDSEQELGFIGLEGLEVESLLAETKTSKFDLTAILTDAGEEIWLELEYSTDLFDEPRIERFVGHLLTLLEGGATNPDLRLLEMPLLTSAERHQLLVEWNTSQSNEVYS
jgi:acyl-CoA synthetase (AMP-forming)/AMP-acid ligase II/acyl carrier protein